MSHYASGYTSMTLEGTPLLRFANLSDCSIVYRTLATLSLLDFIAWCTPLVVFNLEHRGVTQRVALGSIAQDQDLSELA